MNRTKAGKLLDQARFRSLGNGHHTHSVLGHSILDEVTRRLLFDIPEKKRHRLAGPICTKSSRFAGAATARCGVNHRFGNDEK
jgi:hypothetical protein